MRGMNIPVAPFDARADDVAHLARLHAACFAVPWDGAALAALLAAPGHFAFHHADGFVLARAAGGEAEILTLAVRPLARRRGLGRALVAAALAQARDAGAAALFLEVGVENPAALALYAGLGFVQVGRRKGYYRDGLLKQAGGPGSTGGGGDALVLRLSL